MLTLNEGLDPEMVQWHLWLSLQEQLHYDPLTGVWTWKVTKKGPGAKVGKIAGTIGVINGCPRRFIKFNQEQYFASRLAWFYMTREWPTEIDHEDRDSLNDRWHNLREVTHAENMANTSLRNNPITGKFERHEDH